MSNKTDSLRRFDFSTKAVYHLPYFDRILKGEKLPPISVEVHPTNKCNANCPMCFYKERRSRKELSYDLLEDLARELKETEVKTMPISGGGEPTVYNQLPSLMKTANKNNLKIGLITNFINPSEDVITSSIDYCEWMRVSLDAGIPETYSKVRGVSTEKFNDVINNTKRLIELRNKKKLKKPDIRLSFAIQKANYKEIEKALNVCRDLEIDYIQFKTVIGELRLSKEEQNEMERIIDKIPHEKWIGSNLSNLRQIFNETKEMEEGRRSYDKCFATYIVSAIGADSYVYPCCQQVGIKQYRIGSIEEDSFWNIWTSEKYEKFRKEIDPKKCPPCRYNRINVVFDNFVKNAKIPEEEDIIRIKETTQDIDFL